MVTIKNLAFSYTEKLFSDLSLQINPGNICGLLGKNGAGKTTLLRLMCGLLFAKSGQCDVLGFNPKDRDPCLLEEIYFIPEEFYLPQITVTDYLKIYSPFYHKFNSETFYNCIKEFELDQNKNLSEMSYGQKKKFLVAFGIATNCKIFILDEPTNGLDIPSKSQFRKLLASAITDEKIFIISTHQVREVENLIDPIIILDEGKIILNQTIESITKKLSFETNLEESCLKDALYVEKGFQGVQAVTINTTGSESKINLEMLFNAVISNKEKIRSMW